MWESTASLMLRKVGSRLTGDVDYDNVAPSAAGSPPSQAVSAHDHRLAYAEHPASLQQQGHELDVQRLPLDAGPLNSLRGRLTTWPNPMVGCVVVQHERIVGEGWHATFGRAHAEVNALRQVDAGLDLSTATAYVTLEPCSHTGKTPPCADLLLARGVGRVVVAMEDPNPQVSGRGVARLKQAGVQVEVGCLAENARALIRPFVHAMTSPRPWITSRGPKQ